MELTIGEVARRAGLRASAIRYYERAGLVPRAMRQGGQRRYDDSILDRLAVIERAKRCGFKLEEIRELFRMDGPPSSRWGRLANKKMAELDAMAARIAEMKRLLAEQCHCADFGECGRCIRTKEC